MPIRTVVPPELASAAGMIDSRRGELQRVAEPTEREQGQLAGLTEALALLMIATTTPAAPAVNGHQVR